ncbi:MAG: RNA methyltransferase [Clostridiales bacterium]|jgi:TrmH family RNA methyltransferase|nr:RNA methyltransferase [Clostridiales bacterium]
MLISSISNKKIKELLELKDKKGRESNRAFIVEGINILKDIPEYISILEYVVRDDISDNEFVPRRGVAVTTVTAKVFSKISDVKTPQGVAAIVSIRDAKFTPNCNALVLDRIRDPGNAGTLIRSAAAFGYKNVFFINGADMYSPKVVRSSMGGLFRLNLFEVNEEDLCEYVKKDKYHISALDAGGVNIQEYVKTYRSGKPNAIIVGNEADGISKTLLNLSDVALSIKMDDGIESLNAGVAGSLAMYILRQ